MKQILPVILWLFFSSSVHAESRLRIATTLSTFASLAESIGGDAVKVSTVVSPRFNPHFIEPRPSDVLKVKRADLFVHAGLDLEAWRGPLLDAVARADLRQGGERELDLSASVVLLNIPRSMPSRAQGDIHLFGNPHYWLSPDNGARIIDALTAKFRALDPGHAQEFRQRAAQLRAALEERAAVWRAQAAAFRGAQFIGYHDEWVYLMDSLGLQMQQFLEPLPGIPPIPKHLLKLKEFIRTESVRGIVQATFYPRATAESLAKETGVKHLFLCQNVGELPECSDYIAMMEYNVNEIFRALR